MKKLFVLALIACFVVSLSAGCGGGGANTKKTEPAKEKTEPAKDKDGK